MTEKRNLAATISRAIFDRIERDRTLILQNIEEVIRDQLAIEGAKRCGDPAQPKGCLTFYKGEWIKIYKPSPEADMGEYFAGEYPKFKPNKLAPPPEYDYDAYKNSLRTDGY